jgi:hypothetical protein
MMPKGVEHRFNVFFDLALSQVKIPMMPKRR